MRERHPHRSPKLASCIGTELPRDGAGFRAQPGRNQLDVIGLPRVPPSPAELAAGGAAPVSGPRRASSLPSTNITASVVSSTAVGHYFQPRVQQLSSQAELIAARRV
jgi:hypothetical protein